MTVLVAVAEEVRTRAVSVVTLKLSEPAVARRAGRGLIGAVSAVALTVTLPPDRNTTVGAEVRIKRRDLDYVKNVLNYIQQSMLH